MRITAAFQYFAIAALAVVAVLLGLLPASAEKRVALVIGNGAYKNAPVLPNPKNDAEDVAAALKRTGIETILGLDLDKAGMEDATIRFARAAREADVAIFYYSGHAMQFAGVNYLMPINARLDDEADLRRMVRVDDIVSEVQQAKNLRVVVLDSCRDNPLAEELKRSIGRTRGAAVQRGLAKIESPHGMIIAYSTQAGRTAEDGTGRNSPYTSAFLRHIETAEEIGTIFRNVSHDVYQATQHAQLPELSLSIIGQFYLNGQLNVAIAPAAPPIVQVPADDPAQRAWNAIRDTTSIAVIEVFLKDFGDSFYARFARARLDELKKNQVVVAAPPSLPETKPSPVPDRSCLNEPSLKSTEGRISTSITVKNNSAIPIQFYWIDYMGKRAFYMRIDPGRSITQPTFVTHPWVITDAANKCLAVYLPENQPREFVVR